MTFLFFFFNLFVSCQKIGCVGKKLSFTVDHLEHGKVYYFNLFSIEKKRNLSLPYGNVTIKYDKKLHPLGLRDNKPLTVNLRRLDGRASFHYKVCCCVWHKNWKQI